MSRLYTSAPFHNFLDSSGSSTKLLVIANNRIGNNNRNLRIARYDDAMVYGRIQSVPKKERKA